MQSFVDQMGLTYPILMDEDGSVSEDYDIVLAVPSAAYPRDWVVGTDGIIIYANNGFEADEMAAALERELDGG